MKGIDRTTRVTLIQTLVTAHHIVQISDRRLTRADGSVFDDDHNKAVSWCGQFAVGFTGIAFIDRQQSKPVSEWIAEQLWMKDELGAGIEAIRSEAEAALKRLDRRWNKRLSIVVTGFTPPNPFGLKSAFAARISNFERGSEVLPVHQDSFIVDTYQLPDSSPGFGYMTAGAHLSMDEMRIIRRRIPRLIQEGEWNQAIRLLVEVQRLVSNRERTVGRDAMCVSIQNLPALLAPFSPASTAAKLKLATLCSASSLTADSTSTATDRTRSAAVGR